MKNPSHRYAYSIQPMIATAAVASIKRPRVLNVPIDPAPWTEAISTFSNFLSSSAVHQVVTADSSMIITAQRDPQLMEVLQRADYVTPDSEGVIWALSRKTGQSFERVTGVDLVDRISSMCAERALSVYYFGSAEGVAKEASETLKQRYPGLRVAGTRDGFFPPELENQIVAEIAATRPDVIFVALGQPKQELFIHRHKETIGAKIAMGVGGSFDVISGRVKRAPKLIIKVRLEWFWRSALNRQKHQKLRCLPEFVRLVLADKS